MLGMLKKRHMLLVVVILLGGGQSAMCELTVEAALPIQEVLTAEEKPPQYDQEADHVLNLRKSLGWGQHSYVERLFQRNSKKWAFSAEGGKSLRLKSRGKLPGIELGVEMHSLQAFQSVIPQENLPKGLLDGKQNQPLLLPPSVNAPDYNGGFLRFTW